MLSVEGPLANTSCQMPLGAVKHVKIMLAKMLQKLSENGIANGAKFGQAA